MKIGIYGGSFNPPHNMHLEMAKQLVEKKYLDKVIFVPTGSLYPKKGLAPGNIRLEMIQEMIQDFSHLEVSDFELKNKLVYTYQTLKYFQELYPHDDIYFILGADLVSQIKTWRNYLEILENYKLLVTLRNHYPIANLEKESFPHSENIIPTNLQLKDLSSTEIRQACLEDNMPFLEENLPEPVLQYILKNNLYKEIG